MNEKLKEAEYFKDEKIILFVDGLNRNSRRFF